MYVFSISKQLLNVDLSKPIQEPPRKTPPKYVKEVDQMLEDYLKLGVIEEDFGRFNYNSLWIAKKDGTTRWCMDLRPLNAVLSKIKQ